MLYLRGGAHLRIELSESALSWRLVFFFYVIVQIQVILFFFTSSNL